MSRGTVFKDTVNLVTEECYKCGATFAFPEEIYNRCLRNHNRLFYCPNGHGQVYNGITDEQKLRERLEQEQRRVVEIETRANRVSGNYSRMRKRIANGVCPCCNRTFQNLLNHMRKEHPDFSNEKILKSLRLLFGLTQAELSEEAGVNAAYISNYERGAYVPECAGKRIENWLNSHTK